MISPNKIFKLNAILFFLLGIIILLFSKGFNKILSAFMFCYSYINLLALRCKGKKKIKYFLLKVNLIVLSLLIIISTKNLVKQKYKNTLNLTNNDYQFILILILLLILIFNYISFKNFKFN